MKLFITRHGQTDWNLRGIIQGTTDIPLNDTGRAQALTVAKELKEEKLDAIIVSPLKRAVETAEIINQWHQLPIQCDERLAERCFGDYEGTPIADFDFCGFWNQEKEANFPSCEKTSDFFLRVHSFIEECRVKYANQNVLAVAHGGVSLPFYTYFKEIENDHDMRRYMLNNCEVACYEL